MGADERAQLEAGGNGGETDEWFQKAAARWERQKAEEKARAEEKAGAESAQTQLAPEAGKPASLEAPRAEESLTANEKEPAAMVEPVKAEERRPPAQRETDELQSDLRDMAAAALTPPAHSDSRPGLRFVAPPVEEAVEIPRPKRRWKIPAAVAVAIFVLASSVALIRRAHDTVRTAPEEAVAAPPAPASPTESQPVAAPPPKPETVEAEKAEPTKAAPKQIGQKTTAHHAAKSRTSVKHSKKKPRTRH